MATHDPTFAPPLSQLLTASPISGGVGQAAQIINPSQIAGFPSDQTRYLSGDGSWRLLPGRPLYSLTLSSSTLTFDVQGISSAFTNLTVVVTGRTTNAVTNNQPTLRFNNDSGANYNWEQLLANAATVSSSAHPAATSIDCGLVAGNSAAAGQVGTFQISIPNYANISTHKIMFSQTFEGLQEISLFAGRWSSTSAINRITIIPASNASFSSSSQITVYGS